MELRQFVKKLVSAAAQLIYVFGHLSSGSVRACNAHLCYSPH